MIVQYSPVNMLFLYLQTIVEGSSQQNHSLSEDNLGNTCKKIHKNFATHKAVTCMCNKIIFLTHLQDTMRMLAHKKKRIQKTTI